MSELQCACGELLEEAERPLWGDRCSDCHWRWVTNGEYDDVEIGIDLAKEDDHPLI